MSLADHFEPRPSLFQSRLLLCSLRVQHSHSPISRFGSRFADLVVVLIQLLPPGNTTTPAQPEVPLPTQLQPNTTTGYSRICSHFCVCTTEPQTHTVVHRPQPDLGAPPPPSPDHPPPCPPSRKEPSSRWAHTASRCRPSSWPAGSPKSTAWPWIRPNRARPPGVSNK